MNELRKRVRKEYGDEIKELIDGVMFKATMMNAVDNGLGFEFVNLIIEGLEKIKQKTEECEKDDFLRMPEFEELCCVKSYTIADFAKIKDAENSFCEDEEFLKERLAKAVKERMTIERKWDNIGNVETTASIWVQK